MNIKELVDKICKEGDINPNEYTVADRIVDINSKYLEYVEWAMQIGSTETIANQEVKQEIFTLVDGLNTLVRTIPDMPFTSLEYTSDVIITADTRWCSLAQDTFGYWCNEECNINISFDEKQIVIEKGRVCSIRAKYARGIVVPFTMGDYLNVTPPSPVWLPSVFNDLLWLDPATIKAEYYKKDRAVSLRNQLTKLEQLFYNHYSRNATQISSVKTQRGNNR